MSAGDEIQHYMDATSRLRGRVSEVENSLGDLITAVSNVIDYDLGAWHGSQLKAARDRASAVLSPDRERGS